MSSSCSKKILDGLELTLDAGGDLCFFAWFLKAVMVAKVSEQSAQRKTFFWGIFFEHCDNFKCCNNLACEVIDFEQVEHLNSSEPECIDLLCLFNFFSCIYTLSQNSHLKPILTTHTKNTANGKSKKHVFFRAYSKCFKLIIRLMISFSTFACLSQEDFRQAEFSRWLLSQSLVTDANI